MGKLLITAIPSQQLAQAAANPRVTPSPTTPEGLAPGVAAVIRFGKNEYRFNVAGISMSDIINMPSLIPTLENLVVSHILLSMNFVKLNFMKTLNMKNHVT